MRIFQVDAFAERPFGGNPAAVCLLGPASGRASLVGWQASGRGGRVGVELAGDRVLLSGRAVTVLRGDLA